MNKNCPECYWYYEEREDNWYECRHPDYNDDEGDVCPGYLCRADVVGRQYDHNKQQEVL